VDSTVATPFLIRPIEYGADSIPLCDQKFLHQGSRPAISNIPGAIVDSEFVTPSTRRNSKQRADQLLSAAQSTHQRSALALHSAPIFRTIFKVDTHLALAILGCQPDTLKCMVTCNRTRALASIAAHQKIQRRWLTEGHPQDLKGCAQISRRGGDGRYAFEDKELG
jgi:hypothetical protein